MRTATSTGVGKVLVTGATGTVGSLVVRELQRRGVPVCALVRDAVAAELLAGPAVELAIGDFGDAGSLRRALATVDRVFLACGNVPNQVQYETNVIEAGAEMGIQRVVKLSAVGAAVGSPLAFWDWHGRIEQRLHESGVPAVILRPSSYMTNLLASAQTVKRTGTVFAPAADARIAMIDPEDVATAAAVALTHEGHVGKTYVLTGPAAITYADVAAALSEATDQVVRFVNVPDEAARAGMLQVGVPVAVAEFLILLFGAMRAGALEQTTDSVLALTGHEGRTFRQFAQDHAATFRV